MRLLVGLGNPGEKYARNRHNIGFTTIKEVVQRYKLGPSRARFQGITNEGEIGGEKILALRPQTYMNESGLSVGAAMRFFKLTPADIIVFHDEIDLTFGKVRVKMGGGAAGNNGIRSIAAHIGPDFLRVRMGVGHPGERGEVHNHVLSDFSAAERKEIAPLIDEAAKQIGLLLSGDQEGYMNKLALISKPPRNQGPRKPDDGKRDADEEKD
jgi:peptidyl-tRNA hydrolase, PTH1 family